MIAVIFEVHPADGHKQDYLDIAAQMRPLLETIDGFISVEPFADLRFWSKSRTFGHSLTLVHHAANAASIQAQIR